MKVCVVEACERLVCAVGLCEAHYRRTKQGGNGLRPEIPVRYLSSGKVRADLELRIRSRCVRTPDGCLEWRGSTTNGYGAVTFEGARRLVHRAMWEIHAGPLPKDSNITIDHLCKNRACVEVQHLEVVSRGENTRRERTSRTQCKNGHEFTEENTWRSKNGWRYCRTCNRERARERYVRQKNSGST